MKNYDVQDIAIDAPVDRVLTYLAEPANTAQWAEAFASVDGDRAVLRTPAGEVEIGLEVRADAQRGTVDWRMSFPDGSVDTAHSRAVAAPGGGTIYTFVLSPPVAMLEQLEGDLTQQSKILAGELQALKRLVEHGVQA